MKYILIALTLVACSQPAKRAPKEEKTIVLYPFIADQNDWRTGAAYRFTIDSIGLDSNGKVSRKDFTYYRVAVSYKMLDTLGRPKLDSLGRQRDTIQWIDMAEKAIIHDFKKDWGVFVSQSKQQPNK